MVFPTMKRGKSDYYIRVRMYAHATRAKYKKDVCIIICSSCYIDVICQKKRFRCSPVHEVDGNRCAVSIARKPCNTPRVYKS